MSKQRIFYLSIVTSALLSWFAWGLAVTHTELDGILKHAGNNQDICLYTNDGNEAVDLFFFHDDESNLIIDDFGSVKVTGHYFKLLNILAVDEIIIEGAMPALCYLEN